MMGAGASAVAYQYERMGIEIVEGPAVAARMDAARQLPFGAVALSSDCDTIIVTKELIDDATFARRVRLYVIEPHD